MVSAASTGDKRGHHLRVLSVGLPRTGSKSMLRALEILGYRNVHHLGQIWWKPREWAFLDRAADTSFPSLSTHRPDLSPVDWDEMFGQNEAITDAAGIFGPQLIEAYPDAKCVMVMRDFDAWARSVDETLLSYLFSWFKYSPSIACACVALFYGWLSAYLIDPLVRAYSTRAMRKMFMGAMKCRAGEARQKEVLRRFYDEHCAKIQKMVPPERLCVMRLGDGWEPLCRFLGQEVPRVEFPHENDTQEMHMGWQYLRWGILKVAARSKRHIKCDQARPSCVRCTRAGWTCDGYTADQATSIAGTGQKDAAAVVPGSAFSIGRYAIPFKVPGSQRDRQVLHYFCVQGGHEIASYFNTDFWTKTVLQQSHREPVVRQALVSLGALHLDYTTTGAPGSDYTKHGALAQYGRAIHALRRRIEKPGPDTVKTALTCCVLFHAFEAALGNSAAAIRHLDSGLDLLSTHLHDQELGNTDDLNTMSRILESLDIQATIFDVGRCPRLLLSTEVLRGTAAFQSLDEAYCAFTTLQNSFFHFLITRMPYRFCAEESLPSSIAEEKRLLHEHYDGWLARFDQSGLGRDHDKPEYSAARILLISWNVSKMLFEAQYPTNNSVSRVPSNSWAHVKVLDMAQEVLDHSQRGQGGVRQDSGNQRRTFSSGSGVVAPLFALAAKCSDETVCDRALEMLERSRRREGLYDAESMAKKVYQFRSAKREGTMDSDENNVRDITLTSLEKLFEREIDGVVGGMDKQTELATLGAGKRFKIGSGSWTFY